MVLQTFKTRFHLYLQKNVGEEMFDELSPEVIKAFGLVFLLNELQITSWTVSLELSPDFVCSFEARSFDWILSDVSPVSTQNRGHFVQL